MPKKKKILSWLDRSADRTTRMRRGDPEPSDQERTAHENQIGSDATQRGFLASEGEEAGGERYHQEGWQRCAGTGQASGGAPAYAASGDEQSPLPCASSLVSSSIINSNLEDRNHNPRKTLKLDRKVFFQQSYKT